MNKRAAFIALIFAAVALAAGCGRKKPDVNPNASLLPGVYQDNGLVTFVYSTSRTDVTNVCLIGDFNSWKPAGIPMVYEEGVWKLTLKLDYGIYQYKYLLNGTEFVADPRADAYSPDGRGGKNAIVEVTAQTSH